MDAAEGADNGAVYILGQVLFGVPADGKRLGIVADVLAAVLHDLRKPVVEVSGTHLLEVTVVVILRLVLYPEGETVQVRHFVYQVDGCLVEACSEEIGLALGGNIHFIVRRLVAEKDSAQTADGEYGIVIVVNGGSLVSFSDYVQQLPESGNASALGGQGETDTHNG